MKLRVKHGRNFPLGRTVYPAGAEVEVEEKFVRYLTSAKGPLEPLSAMQTAADLPKEVMDPPKSGASRRRYQRRDMTAADGPTGEETSPPSSRRGRRPSGRQSTSSGDEPAS